jgi:hypothetical protein
MWDVPSFEGRIEHPADARVCRRPRIDAIQADTIRDTMMQMSARALAALDDHLLRGIGPSRDNLKRACARWT